MSSKRSKREQPDVRKKTSRLNRQSLFMVSILLVASLSVILTVNPSLDLNFNNGDDGIDEGSNDPDSITAAGVSSADAYGAVVAGPNGNYRLAYNKISGNNVQLMGWDNTSGYVEPSGAVSIPQTFTYSGTTYTVTAIYGSTGSTSAFYGCTNITSISLPNTITSIGAYAFYNCTGLTGTLTLPSNLTNIGMYAFGRCSGFTGTLTLPSTLTTVASYAFYGCTGIAGQLTIPSSLTSIPELVFGNMGIVSVSIPATTTSISGSAFSSSTSLSQITVSGSNPNYSSLNGIVYNKDQTSLVAYPAGRANTSFSVPSSVTSIERYAFYYCANLRSITFPASVTSIGDFSFRSCTGLTSLTLPANLTAIGTSAFGGCTGLTTVTIPSKVLNIGNNAFEDCTNIAGTITIPASVSTIGRTPFMKTSVTNFQVDSGSTAFSSLDGMIYNKAKTTIVMCPAGKTGSVTGIPSTVTAIGAYAFAYCKDITSFEIPSTIKTLGDSSFSNTSGLRSISIPASITTIGTYAFYGSGVDDVYFEGNTLPTMGSTTFSYADKFYSHGVKSASWWVGKGFTFRERDTGAYYELTLAKASGETVFQGFTKVKVPSSTNNYTTAVPITQAWTEQYVPTGAKLLYSTNSGSTWNPLVGVTLTSDTSGLGRIGFTITYNINNGTGTTPSAVTSYGNVSLNNGSGITKSNYYIAGWNTNAAGTGTHYNLGATYNLASNVTLYAEWKQYSITFNTNSSTSGSQASTDGYGNTALPSTSSLVRNGYYLSGWNTNAAGTGTHYNLGATYNITGNVTLYAEWSQYAITFNSNNATSGSQAAVNGYGSTALPSSSSLARTGYYLNGWNTNAAGTGTHYNLGATYNIAGNVTLYAEWKQYTISYNANGATTGFNFTQLGYGSTTLNNGPSLARTNYYLNGWNTNSSGTGTHYNLGATYALNGNVTLYAEWKQYTITFNSNSATSGSQASVNGYGNTALPSSSTLVRTGYYLSGWNTNTAGTGTHYDLGATYSLTGNVTLYAEWKQYTITYNANSATTGSNFTQAGYGSTVLNNGSSLARTNYYLAGWNTSASGNGNHYDLGATYNLTWNTTLYAEWKQYTVTYNNNTGSGTIASQSGVGVTLSNGAAFTKGGYTLTGWNTLANGTGTSYTLSKAVTLTGNVTLYAVWSANPVTVTYHGNGGTGTPANASGVTDGAWTLPTAAQYTRSGYTLAGWATTSGGAVVYAPGASTTFVHTITNVYAVWTAQSATVSFNGNGGTGSPANASGVTGGTYTLPTAAQYTRPGYTLAGWDTNSAGANVVYDAGGTTTFKFNETALYAVWTANSMTVTYHGNGGTGATASSGYTGGTYTVPTASQYLRPGYTLAGWSTTNGGAVNYSPGSTQTFTYGTNNLYAVWTANSMTVTYHGNGGTGTPANVSGVTGGSWTLPSASQYTRPGYTLTGWSTTLNGVKAYDPGQVTTFIYGINNVYAIWQGNPITVTYNGNGGSAASGVSESASGIVGSTYVLPSLSDYVNSGYTLLGWDTDPSASTVVYNPGMTVTFKNGETTLYAVWSGNAHSVVYHGKGGSGPSSASGAVGASWTLPTAVQYTKPGYALTGWSTTDGGPQAYTPGQTAVFDVGVTNVYAIWTPVSVTVVYDGNYGTGSPSDAVGDHDSTWILPTASQYTRPGYTLAGWSLTLNGPIEYLPGGSATFNYLITDVYAVWTADPVTVTYDPKGGAGTPADSSGVTGGAWTLPSASQYTRPGYTLIGWDTSPAATTITYTPGQTAVFAYDVTTVYAVWSPDSMTVNYHGNEGTGSPSSSIGLTGGSWTLPSATDYNRPGYTLVGWDTSPAGTNAVYLQGSTAVFTYGIHDVYAVWDIDTAATYNVDVNAGSGGSAAADNTGPNGGDNVTVTITPDAGYVISTVTDNGSDVYGSLVSIGGGKWTYTISSILADHSVNVTFRIDTGAFYTVSGNVMPNAGSDDGFTVTLNGQSLTTGPGGAFSFSNLPGGFTGLIQVSKDGYVTASYSVADLTSDRTGINVNIAIRSYTVMFNASGADPSSGTWPQSMQTDHGYPLSSVPSDPTMAGHTFAGWFTGGGIEFDPLAPVTGNIELYALWHPIRLVTVSITGNGAGSVQINLGFGWTDYAGPFTVMNGTVISIRATPGLGGHTFAGWTGHLTSADAEHSFAVMDDIQLTATFAEPSQTGSEETEPDQPFYASWMFWILVVLATLLIVSMVLFLRERGRP